ncbi:hypothetical protein ACJMK2_029142 [Sinanodonta woodiana]|uniref:Uncharacterized protein n=1 Tax=Sinanodonta woodiana TaxID=1069815 RepID=A0ABD3XDA3_SINWO
MGSTNVTCGEPPSTLGDLVLYTQQQNKAFYVCPGASAYAIVPLICPILSCQANGTFSTLADAAFRSRCYPLNTSQTVVNTSGEITSPGYPGNYVPALQNTTAGFTIMTPGANLVFRIEDFDIDSSTLFTLVCGYRSCTP